MVAALNEYNITQCDNVHDLFFQLKRLEEKDKLEEEARVELREKAKKELEDWYKQYAEQVKSNTLYCNIMAEIQL